MNIFDFETKYTKWWVNQFGDKVLFFPRSGPDKGAMHTVPKGQEIIGGEYWLRQDFNRLFLGWNDSEFLFSLTNDGFELIQGDAVAYVFTPGA
jgi:hypothetical protein